ncbi:MAG: glutathione S-transferase N-terminal domain-containing protein [Candidatus Omnitrophica bacterium]|nr:glutathione S-transferase N-terminal domain-containing protein [Candidatus Omnitrophota bacterium]
MKLLYTKRSPYARKVRILALEKKIDLQLIDEDLTNKSKVLWDANPLGKIPALLLDDGQAIFDSPVICQYLDGLNDSPILIPRSSKERLAVLQWEAIGDGLTDASLAAYREKLNHPNDVNAGFVAAQEVTIKQTLSYINSNIKHLAALSLAPIAVIAGVGYTQLRMGHLIDAKAYTDLMSWMNDFSKRPSVSSTVPVL